MLQSCAGVKMLNEDLVLNCFCCFPAAQFCLFHSQNLCCARLQVTESAHSEHGPVWTPRNVHHRQQDSLHIILEAGSETSAVTGTGPQQQMLHSNARAEHRVSEKTSGAVPSQKSFLNDEGAQCGCSNQSNGLLSGVLASASGNAAVSWRHEAFLTPLTPDSRLAHARCNEQLNPQSAVEVSPQSRSRWPTTAAESTLLHALNSRGTVEDHCASQVGEAIGEYVMYRF